MSTDEEIHLWQHCHHCNASPITGLRYECQTCPAGPDIDLCSSCFELYEQGMVLHPQGHSHISKDDVHDFLPREGVLAEPFHHWLEIPNVESSEPLYKNGFLVRPEFRFGHESAFGGYGFVVSTPNGNILLTALHVLDEVIKKNNIDASCHNNQYTGLELPKVIDFVNLYDVIEDKWMLYELGSCKTMIVLPDARIGDKEPMSYRDISAFWVEKNSGIQAGTLAKKSPDIGEPVWLAAKMPNDLRTRKAVVVEKTQHSFVFRYDNSEPLPRCCSGAPLLDKTGDVVAINAGAGNFGSQKFGHANCVENIYRCLDIK